MTEVSESKSPSRREVMEAFGDRLLYKPEKTERENLELDENLMEKDLVGSGIARKHDQASISDSNTCNPAEKIDPEILKGYDFFEDFMKPLNATLLKSGSDPVTLSTGIYKTRYKKNGEREKAEDYINLRILRGNLLSQDVNELAEASQSREEGKRMGNFVLRRKPDGVFDLQHRYIAPEYRGPQNEAQERLGNVLLTASEQVAQNFANEEGRRQRIEISSGKLQTIMWMNSTGYKPKTEQDKERLEKILNADESLVVVDDLFVWEKDKWKEGTDTYKKRKESFVVTFEKVFEPNIGDIAEKTRQKIVAKLGIS